MPRFRTSALLLVALLAFFVRPQSALADAPPTGTNRFLFIVDVSTTMKKWDEPVREAVFDMIFSGVRGYMTNGDSFGVWLAGEVNDTSGTVQVWRQKFATEAASRVAMRVKDRGMKGKPVLDLALADAARVARDVGSVTVILISNGDTPLHGTPFDTELNAAVAQMAPAMKQAKATVNVTLVARNGKFEGWAINSPDFLFNMPTLPPPPPPTAAEIAAQKASAPPVETAPKPAPAAAPRVEPTRVASKPIVITRETVGREKEAMRALASTMEPGVPGVAPAPAAQPTQAVVLTRLPQPTNVAPAVTSDAPAVASAVVTNSATNAAVAAPVASAPPPAESAPAVPAKVVEPVAPLPKAIAPVVAQKTDGASSWLWALGGSAGTLVLGLAFWIYRRNRTLQTSLVSEAMAMERLQNQRY